MTAPASTTAIDTYRVTVEHPDLSGPLVMDLIATSSDAAVSRARLSAFHLYRDARLLDAGIEAVLLHPGTCRAADHEREECTP